MRRRLARRNQDRPELRSSWQPHRRVLHLLAKRLSRVPQLSVATDHVVRRAVVAERRLGLALEFRDDALGQYLAQFDSPLIERVDVPDDALGEDAVLVERRSEERRVGK